MGEESLLGGVLRLWLFLEARDSDLTVCQVVWAWPNQIVFFGLRQLPSYFGGGGHVVSHRVSAQKSPGAINTEREGL